jgi:hypothetical protein
VHTHKQQREGQVNEACSTPNGGVDDALDPNLCSTAHSTHPPTHRHPQPQPLHCAHTLTRSLVHTCACRGGTLPQVHTLAPRAKV